MRGRTTNWMFFYPSLQVRPVLPSGTEPCCEGKPRAWRGLLLRGLDRSSTTASVTEIGQVPEPGDYLMCRRALLVCVGWVSLTLFSASQAPQITRPPAVPADAPYKNPGLAVERRVADLLARMTLEEKVSIPAGSGWMESMPIERPGIPAIQMADGPMGVRSWPGSSAIPSAANPPVKRSAGALRGRGCAVRVLVDAGANVAAA